MEIAEWYQMLERLQQKGIIADAYTSDLDNPEGAVLTDFAEFFYENYPDERPLWMEAYYQIFSWQFQSFHEGVETYYENFYGDSDYQRIIKTAEYLKLNGYKEVAEQYLLGAVDCARYEYPQEMKPVAEQIDAWMNRNTETVFCFYMDILGRNKSEINTKTIVD